MNSSVPSQKVITPADILTYYYNDKMVYVTPAETYEGALDYAQDVFPELKSVDRNHISFEIRVLAGNRRQAVRIGPMAWQQVLTTLARYEVIDIRVTAPQTVVEPPPKYSDDVKAQPLSSSEKELNRLEPVESGSGHSRSRSPSPTFLRLAGLFKGSA
ncbi:hypothetical protein EW146_g6831 [Bondarzewia mesenterica]|uniref:Uncharacterized protein n=1 Tax=Bondarzewia mesenterica TaxID=1095465 RepID=A0A4S4LMM0_9AGAM|nr:hypothetical protein EW146_g6831 [Bondarzewia mesenterica]